MAKAMGKVVNSPVIAVPVNPNGKQILVFNFQDYPSKDQFNEANTVAERIEKWLKEDNSPVMVMALWGGVEIKLLRVEE